MTESFQMTQGGYQVIIILPIKSKMAAAKKQFFFFLVFVFVFVFFCTDLSLHLRHLKSAVYK